MRKKRRFGFLSALWFPNDRLAVLDIRRRELQDFADSHAASRHQFNNQPVARIPGSENDLIDHVLFENRDPSRFCDPEHFFSTPDCRRGFGNRNQGNF